MLGLILGLPAKIRAPRFFPVHTSCLSFFSLRTADFFEKSRAKNSY